MLNFFSIKKEDKIFYLILVVAIYFML